MLILMVALGEEVKAESRPNIVWITCEDISPYLGSYGAAHAQTPHLDQLATQGVRFTKAYSPSPTCAPARSALLTGMHSTTLGTHNMRSDPVMPPVIPAYAKLFRQAGYYCSNNNKKDYNSDFNRDGSLWNESGNHAHWKNRPQGTPFFAVFNVFVSHESQLKESAVNWHVSHGNIPAHPRIDPTEIQLPPYHPDLPEIREDWARLHDLITHMDEIVGEYLQELKDEGVAEDTIVFFFSDHGGHLARSKRYVYNAGTQVPMIVWVPEKYQHLLPSLPGTTFDEKITFVDLPKTALSIAGIPVPELMQGRIFLGPNREPEPEFIHFYRDRQAERYDFSRAVSDGRYTLIRNFMPHRPQGLEAGYPYQVQSNWSAWREAYENGQCNEIQSRFFRPPPAVQLFDTQQDPWHTQNLADDPAYSERRHALASQLETWMVETRDLGLIPEPLYPELVGPVNLHATLFEYGQAHAALFAELVRAATLSSYGDPDLVPEYMEMLSHQHPAVRYWGGYGLFQARPDTPGVRLALSSRAENDTYSGVRSMAAQALAVCGDPVGALNVLKNEADMATHAYPFLFALNAIQNAGLDLQVSAATWSNWNEKTFATGGAIDSSGAEYATRLLSDGQSRLSDVPLKMWRVWPKSGFAHTSRLDSIHWLEVGARDRSFFGGYPQIQWSKVRGPGAIFLSNPDAAGTALQVDTPGSYLIRATAQAHGESASVDVTLLVGAQDPPGNRYVHWACNEGQGTEVSDATGHERSGGTATPWTADKLGVSGSSGDYALSFANRESHQAVLTPHSLGPLTAFTVSVWVYADRAGTDAGIFSARPVETWSTNAPPNPGITLRYDAEGWFTDQVRDDGSPKNVIQGLMTVGTGASTIQLFVESSKNRQVASQWQHLVLTWSAGKPPRLYINGVEDKGAVFGTRVGQGASVENGLLMQAIQDTEAWILGRSWQVAGQMSWEGRMDEFSFFTRQLGPEDVMALYAAHARDQVPHLTVTAAADIEHGSWLPLIGQVSGNEGEGSSFTWKKISGPGSAVFSNPNQKDTSVRFDGRGTYVIALTAGNLNTSAVTMHTIDVMHAPIRIQFEETENSLQFTVPVEPDSHYELRTSDSLQEPVEDWTLVEQKEASEEETLEFRVEKQAYSSEPVRYFVVTVSDAP